MEFIRRNNKNILIGVLLILFIGACAIIFYLLNNRSTQMSKEITGKVIVSDKEYLIIESDKENYLISNIKGVYDIGDVVKFSYLESNVNNDINPKEIKISDEELIEKNEVENKDEEVNENDKEIDNKEETNNQITSNNNSNNQSTTSKPNNNISTNTNSTNNTSADVEVMNYINTLQTEMDKPSLGESVKNGFVTVIDFLFYQGTIKGHTFNELSNSAKLKVLEAALYFDSKIEKYFPGYKESISGTANKIYNNVKSNIVSAYLNITTSICTSNNDLCNSAKEGFQSLKRNFGLTFDLIKDIAGDGITNLKNWYEIWSGK